MPRKTTDYTWCDESASLIVVRCHACPYWHGFAMDRGEFHDVAVRHEHTIHPGVTNAECAREQYRRRQRKRR
ncbi:stress-inducible protein [Leifsonia xyli subsp. cynodontis DSM 46306]|jgi:hypothetical protein|uniref:Uncharacterized protein n=1 Tax=Leifsonia xyli subsp. cynodontis DSM 46306 TaxID=1389489 RepID=U3PCI5_LEIXC|nr:hypothetical protein [Leifsonia xyli]AGW42462.1 stress-inducible protein [Leifsonia xyli subsp. cynodontis DSM 46306]